MNVASKLIAQHPRPHELAVGIMFDQVVEAGSNDVDTVLIDGRAMEQYGHDMHIGKLGLYVLGYYFKCDSYTAARRVLKEFRPLCTMPDEDKSRLLEEVDNIASRNADDASRHTDPMKNADHALSLDLTRGLHEDDDARFTLLDQGIETGVVSVDTSYTTKLQQMTEPVIAVTRHVLADGDERIRNFAMLHRAHRNAYQLSSEAMRQ